MGKCKFVFFPYKVGHFFSPPSYAIRDLAVFTRGWAADWRTHPDPFRPRAASPRDPRARGAFAAAREWYRQQPEREERSRGASGGRRVHIYI